MIPQDIENKIFLFLSHPISDILRGTIVILRKQKYDLTRKTSFVNFTNNYRKGLQDICLVHVYERNNLWRTLWSKKVSNHVTVTNFFTFF